MSEKPTEQGLYVVAKFEGDKMVEFCDEWALIEGYWGPNRRSYCGSYDMTHWMPRADYRRILETTPRDEAH